MKARDIMAVPVITIGPDTPVGEIAALLLERRISGVPVIEDGRLVGLVSEGDLLHRQEIGTDRSLPERSWWMHLIEGDQAPAEYIKSHARQARDIMTRNVVSIAEETSIAQIASILVARRIKRVPVLKGKELVGIVSRADLIHALALKTKAIESHRAQSDDAIQAQLVAELEQQPWWRRASSTLIVTDGVVHYWGLLETEGEREAARVAAENVQGVRSVEDHRMKSADWPSML